MGLFKFSRFANKKRFTKFYFMSETKLSVLVSILILLNSVKSDSSHIQLSDTKSTIYSIPNFQSYAYFKYSVESLHEKEDLIFSINPIEWYADPNAFASSTNPFPNNWNNAEYVCYSFGLEMCTIPANQISQGKTFYLGVYCEVPCTIQIETIYETEKTLLLSTPKTIVFSKKNKPQGELIEFKIPEETKAEHFLISAIPKDYQTLNRLIVFESVFIFLKSY
jgi:hypothetical protein